MTPTTADEPIEFDARLAAYIHSVDPDALARMAQKFAMRTDVKSLQAIVVSGVLGGTSQERDRPVGNNMVEVVRELVKGRNVESFDVVPTWLTQCAQSNPTAVAREVYGLLAQNYINDDSLAKIFGGCLKFDTPYGDLGNQFEANNQKKYFLYELTIGGILALHAPSAFAELAKNLGWNNTFEKIPSVGKIQDPDTLEDGAKPVSVNLVELLLMGASPHSPENAWPDLAKSLALLNLDSQSVPSQLSDSIVRANQLGLLTSSGQLDEPMLLVTQMINAGAEIGGREDLLSNAVFVAKHEGPTLNLLAALCSVNWDFGDSINGVSVDAELRKAVTRVLEEGGVDPNFRNPENGWTALHMAIQRGNRGLIEILLEHGADTSIKDPSFYVDAASYASKMGQKGAAAMIGAWNARQAINAAISQAAGRAPGAGTP